MTIAAEQINLRDALAVWRRNVVVHLRVWKMNLVAPIIEPVISVLGFGWGIGALVAGRVAGIIASLLALTVAILVLLGVLLTPWLLILIAPGFKGDVRELTIVVVRILFPGIGRSPGKNFAQCAIVNRFRVSGGTRM